MGNLIRTSMLLALVSFVFFAFASDVRAQCVRCKVIGQCFACGPATSGGCTCAPSGCTVCVESQPCGGPGVCGQGERTEQACDAGLKIDDSVILKIAEAHPRFAVGLAMINRIGGIKDAANFHFFATDLGPNEVRHWLKETAGVDSHETAVFFHEFSKRPIRSSTPLRIEFALAKRSEKGWILIGTIKEPFEGDPPGTQIEVSFVDGKGMSWKIF